MLFHPREIAIYANRFPRLYRMPTIIAMARGYRKRGMRFILAIDARQNPSKALDYLRRRVEVEAFRTLALRAVQGYQSKWFNLLASPGFFLRCLRLRPRVLVQEGVGAWGALSPVLKFLFGTKIVVSFERTETSEIRASGIKTLYQTLYLRSVVDKVVANGSRTVRLLRIRLRYTGDISVGNVLAYVPRRSRFDGVAGKRSSLAAPAGSRSSNPAQVHVLVVMLMIERKGVDRLVRVLNAIAQDPSVRWTIIGTGSQAEAVAAAASSNVTLIPEVPPHRVYDYYRDADYLVLPTREDNWSLVVHEAMACGVVPITTIENGVVPDLVDSLSGHVLDFDSPFIVEAVQAILKRGRLTPELRRAQQCRAQRIGTHLRVGSSFVPRL
jgi:glycosyltransferase involved in cell wall biosynthesis